MEETSVVAIGGDLKIVGIVVCSLVLLMVFYFGEVGGWGRESVWDFAT